MDSKSQRGFATDSVHPKIEPNKTKIKEWASFKIRLKDLQNIKSLKRSFRKCILFVNCRKQGGSTSKE